MRIRASLYLSRTVGFLLALCLAIAPICSARCSLSSCLPATTPDQSTEGCHQHAAPQPTDAFDATASNSCQTADSLLTALPANSLRLLRNGAMEIQAVAIETPPVVPSLFSTNVDSQHRGASPGRSILSSTLSPLRL